MVKLKENRHPIDTLTSTRLLARLRAIGISTPRAMVLAAVRDGSAKYKAVYVGEIHAMYLSNAHHVQSYRPYTYAGVSSMLRVLHADGLIHKTKDGGWVQYSISPKGRNILAEVGV